MILPPNHREPLSGSKKRDQEEGNRKQESIEMFK